MSRLIRQAGRLLGSKPSATATLYSIRCPCGKDVEGLRRPIGHSAACSSCGGLIFVLPVSPLPAVVSAAGSASAARSTTRRSGRKSSREQARPRRDGSDAPAPELDAEEPSRRNWLRPALIIPLVVACLLCAAAWEWRRSTLQTLRETLVPAARQGLQALADGRIEEARERLGYAVRALDRLHEPFAEEDQYRQAYLELATLGDLLTQPLDDALRSINAAPDLVGQTLKSQTLVIDAMVEPDSERGYRIGYTPLADGEPVEVAVGSLQLFHRMQIKQPLRVIFGVRMTGVEKDSDGRWRILIDPQSGVLLTELAVFQRLGILRDPESAALRSQQLRWVDATIQK